MKGKTRKGNKKKQLEGKRGKTEARKEEEEVEVWGGVGGKGVRRRGRKCGKSGGGRVARERSEAKWSGRRGMRNEGKRNDSGGEGERKKILR